MNDVRLPDGAWVSVDGSDWYLLDDLDGLSQWQPVTVEDMSFDGFLDRGVGHGVVGAGRAGLGAVVGGGLGVGADGRFVLRGVPAGFVRVTAIGVYFVAVDKVSVRRLMDMTTQLREGNTGEAV